MQKIIPHLWFDKEAKEAAEFYVAAFQNARLLSTSIIEDTPSGNAEMVSFELEGMTFSAISAGPYFKFNPSISLMVYCDSEASVREKWDKLIVGGQPLMHLAEYPFSPCYGWLMDKYGLSWQLMEVPPQADRESATNTQIKISFLFSEEACGMAEDAMHYYADLFKNGSVGYVNHYEPGEAKLPQARINYGEFSLEGLNFVAMDNGYSAEFGFNEAFSLMVMCEDQEEVDYFWNGLTSDPEAEQCGWLRDQFGVSWQIVPRALNDLMDQATPDQKKRLTEAFLQMKKFDIAALEQAMSF